MLLETKNIKKNDIIIYSRNSIDEDYNFRIIFKNDPKLYHRKISFDYTKKLITEYFPKNLIAYRIMTNFPEMLIPSTNYGCVIHVNSEQELIFTDPVYAVKTIEEYLEFNSNDQFKFKIQRVGYSTINKIGNSANYTEEFFYDLKIQEATNQNDAAYLESLLIKDIQAEHISKNIDELKRSVIFTPENKMQDISQPILNPENASNIIRVKRENKTAERDLANGSKKLHSGVIHDFRVEEKSDEQLFPDENPVKEPTAESKLNDRMYQYKFREHRITEINLFDEEVKNEPRTNLTKEEEAKYNEFRNSPGAEPVESHKVKIEKNGSVKAVEINPQKRNEDDLFTKFLKDLQNESKMKIKKQNKLKRKGRESDIIQLFKSVRSEQTNQNTIDEKNIILKLGKNSEAE